MRITLASALALAATLVSMTRVVASAQYKPPLRQTEPAWSVTLDEADPIVRSAWSPINSCIAVATGTTIHVVDLSGHVTWSWNYRAASRYLHVMYSLAVSPTCDTVAAAGFDDYRYVWVAEQSGATRYFKVEGTPWVVKFSLDGSAIAVATGWPRGYLFSARQDAAR